MISNPVLIIAFVTGAAITHWVKSRVHFIFKLESLTEEIGPNFSKEMMFDCPVCKMPAEINSILTHMGEGSDYNVYYVLNCLGEHETAAVTEQWYRENVGQNII